MFFAKVDKFRFATGAVKTKIPYLYTVSKAFKIFVRNTMDVIQMTHEHIP